MQETLQKLMEMVSRHYYTLFPHNSPPSDHFPTTDTIFSQAVIYMYCIIEYCPPTPHGSLWHLCCSQQKCKKLHDDMYEKLHSKSQQYDDYSVPMSTQQLPIAPTSTTNSQHFSTETTPPMQHSITPWYVLSTVASATQPTVPTHTLLS